MKIRDNTSLDPMIERQLVKIRQWNKDYAAMKEKEANARPTGQLDKTGKMICEGHRITTSDNTVYTVGFDKDEAVLVGIKPLSYVNCIPTIVGFTDEPYKN